MDELIEGVNIALGSGSLTDCSQLDDNGDQLATVDELVTADNNARQGCPPEPSATPTPSETATASSTPTVTPTPTITQTPSRTLTASRSPTVTRTATPTRTPTFTATASRTATPTRTPTFTVTRTVTRTPTNTFTTTATATVTLTPSRTGTPTVTPTITMTPTPTATWNGPRFADNGDGTITDHETGLTWEKKSDDGSVHDKDNQYILSTGAPWGPTGPAYTQFLTTLNHQAFGGYTDWRIPTIQELAALLNCSNGIDPAFYDQCGAGCTVTNCSCTAPYNGNPASPDGSAGAIYWSSSSFPSDPVHAQLVVFGADGGVGFGKFRAHFVRAVRGAPPAYRFVDNGNGTITDSGTGLMWEKKSNDGSIHDKSKTYTWSTGAPWSPNGTVFTQFLATLNAQTFAGYHDWRLPTSDEFAELNSVNNVPCGRVNLGYPIRVDLAFANLCPCYLEGHPCTCRAIDTACSCLSDHPEWSSTTTNADVSEAFAFSLGDTDPFAESKNSAPQSARAVRSGP